MSFEMYKKEGIEFPYLIDTRYEKSTSEGVVKEKYERRWVVRISEINDFIKSLELSYNELALASVTRDDRGAISVVTAIYGEAGLSDEFLDADGVITLATFNHRLCEGRKDAKLRGKAMLYNVQRTEQN